MFRFNFIIEAGVVGNTSHAATLVTFLYVPRNDTCFKTNIAKEWNLDKKY